jgi:hypothetical protein
MKHVRRKNWRIHSPKVRLLTSHFYEYSFEKCVLFCFADKLSSHEKTGQAKKCLLFCPAIALGVRYAGLAAAIALLGNTRGFFIKHV